MPYFGMPDRDPSLKQNSQYLALAGELSHPGLLYMHAIDQLVIVWNRPRMVNEW